MRHRALVPPGQQWGAVCLDFRFTQNLHALPTGDAGLLFDFSVRLMDREISEGWRAFYVSEILLREHLPAPLMNELGRDRRKSS